MASKATCTYICRHGGDKGEGETASLSFYNMLEKAGFADLPVDNWPNPFKCQFTKRTEFPIRVGVSLADEGIV